MNSIQIVVIAGEEEQEILISRLEDFNANGFEQTEDSLIAYFAENNFDSYEINQLLKNYSFTISTIQDRNWNEVWESNFQPVVVDDFCAIRANFHQPMKDVDYEIIITPKMSFGTGHHATTYMMIEQMRHLDFKGKTVFDFGTGTGILAILAEKLGAAGIQAIDIDDWSIQNAKENFEKNFSFNIDVALSSKIPAAKFDIILANINRNVIVQYLPKLKNALSENGFLLLSGLLASDEKYIIETCNQQNFSMVRKTEKDNWISLLLVNCK